MNLKKIIDEELESMTFNELKNRRSIKMKKNVNFSVKRTVTAAAAVIAAAALLAVSTSAMGLWSISDFINRTFPGRTEEVEPYAFSSGISEGSTNQFNFSAGNFLCDGNTLITEFIVTKADGSEFTTADFVSVSFGDEVIFPDMPDMKSLSSGSRRTVSDDNLSWIVTSRYKDLTQRLKPGDRVQVKINGAQELVIKTENGGGDYETFDDGTVIFNYTVPDIPDPIPLEFKDENGNKVFDAELTPLSMTARADSPVFEKYNTGEYILYPDGMTEYDEQVEWYISNPTNPKFYDENMELTDNNPYNGTKYIINSDGNSQRMDAQCEKVFIGDHASILFVDSPEYENARYIEWFDCIAEIPQNE
ncbi:MAG: hypothetical protein NC253_13385 [Ruminococcus sp.]|nr:hypothetical protein [Ruminococcus sp.]MCM1381518.1 hypothetical protein [Muribaculaceae bacterium]MCM1479271.1 hypothetical protein [Muribaculaceae bacterium]